MQLNPRSLTQFQRQFGLRRHRTFHWPTLCASCQLSLFSLSPQRKKLIINAMENMLSCTTVQLGCVYVCMGFMCLCVTFTVCLLIISRCPYPLGRVQSKQKQREALEDRGRGEGKEGGGEYRDVLGQQYHPDVSHRTHCQQPSNITH